MKTTGGKTIAVLVPLLFALPASAHFFWPIGGPITRCAEGHGYNACDIAGPNGYRVGTSNTGYYHAKLWDADGYGNYAMVRHPNTCGQTDYYTLYAHLSSFTGYAIGTKLVRGEPTGTEADGMDSVGYEGSTGRSTGPHVHFEIRRGSTKLYFYGSGTVNKNTSVPGSDYSCVH
jgi:murein DD-endopeptidase MepM/ murein hydrolase activator NlpD